MNERIEGIVLIILILTGCGYWYCKLVRFAIWILRRFRDEQ